VTRRAVVLAVAAGFAAVASSCGGKTAATVSPHVIAFSSDRALPPASEAADFDTRRLDLYLMNADGTHLERLTRNALTDVFPAVAHDGTRIAFTRDIEGYAQVFVMDLRDREVHMLTHARANSGLPAWSPDGRRIAFATDRNAPGGDVIFVMNADGSDQHAVTHTLPRVNDAWPTWSPDGKRIAFARESGAGSAIYVVGVRGDGLTRLTKGASSLDTQPAWAPDGTEIAFESDVFLLPGQIFAMKPDGTRRHQLTDPGVGASSRPSWSSDGKLIVFMSSRNHPTDVWVMHRDGTHKLQLTRNHGFAGFPAAG
jgi:TolB protein